MTYPKKLYICHYCIDYKTGQRKDMIKHFDRKKSCKCNTLLSYEEAKEKTLYKKFYFYFDFHQLIRNDFIQIVSFYNEKENYIYDNYSDFIYESNMKKMEEEEKKNKHENDAFDKLYYNHEKEKYECKICNSEYTSKQNMKKHLLNIKQCDAKKKLNDMIELNKEKTMMILEKKKKEDDLLQSFILQKDNSNSVIQKQNNIQQINQNIQNFHNNNQNNQSSTFRFSLKDFVNERYDISHIKDNFYLQKDFFLYHNFLKVIMENEKNQNIFFANNEAIVYTDNELNKMSSDKAGYLILDKLSQSFSQLLYQQGEETQDYFAFITKYYNVLKGQYKHDTIYKDYDVDERRFYYTSNSGLFRSRDKYLNKMVSTINKNSDNVRKHMNFHTVDIKDIPTMNPNIEDFASIKMRYRDLRDRD